MTIEMDDVDEPDPRDCLEVILTPGNHRVLENPPIPFTADDLRAAFRLSDDPGHNAAKESALIDQLNTPAGVWELDIVMLVALLSPDHERRAASYLHMAPQMLEQRLKALRGRIDAP
jgi:hypothetical protein